MHKPPYHVKDLGDLVGDVLLFGGPYSNLQASEAMLAVAQALSVPAGNRICTGDVVAYGANPVETLELWRDHCVLVAGNCERQLGAGAEDCGCGFEAGSACDMLSRGWFRFASTALSADDRAYLAAAPDLVVFSHFGKRYAVIHGGLSDVARFLWPVSPETEFLHEVGLISADAGPVDCVIAGHSGLAFQTRVGGVEWVNAGVIGMPPNDGQPETRYVVLGEGGVRVERLAYDFDAARRAMEHAGLVQGYERALSNGYWPNEDIMPEVLRR